MHRWRRRMGRRESEGACTLDRMGPGDRFVIEGVDDEQARVQAIRFGVTQGSEASCSTRVPQGPIVLRRGRQEIAIGRALARRIRVRRLDGREVA